VVLVNSYANKQKQKISTTNIGIIIKTKPSLEAFLVALLRGWIRLR